MKKTQCARLRTIQDFIRWAYSYFNAADIFYGHGTDNSWDEAVSLVLQALFLPVDFDKQYSEARLTAEECVKLERLIVRRVEERVPVAYLVQQAWFCDLPFYVDERVIIPRSPIAELIKKRFQPWLTTPAVPAILDLCTGSGCIGIACAYAFAQSQVDLVDISPEALEVARINIDKHQLWERVIPIASDLFSTLEGRQYTLIVSNPPYVGDAEFAELPAEFYHEPRLALHAAGQGLSLVEAIICTAPDFLQEEGLLVVEVGNGQELLVEKYPQFPFKWVTFTQGGQGVFILTKQQCLSFCALFLPSNRATFILSKQAQEQ